MVGDMEREGHWCTYWQGARLPLAREDTGGANDKVIRTLAEILAQERQKKRQSHLKAAPPIQFIREGEKKHKPPRRPTKASYRQPNYGR